MNVADQPPPIPENAPPPLPEPLVRGEQRRRDSLKELRGNAIFAAGMAVAAYYMGVGPELLSTWTLLIPVFALMVLFRGLEITAFQYRNEKPRYAIFVHRANRFLSQKWVFYGGGLYGGVALMTFLQSEAGNLLGLFSGDFGFNRFTASFWVDVGMAFAWPATMMAQVGFQGIGIFFGLGFAIEGLINHGMTLLMPLDMPDIVEEED